LPGPAPLGLASYGDAVENEELETPRLRLRRWAETDVALLVHLSSMPSVMRFIRSGALWSAEAAERVASEQLVHWDRHGFAWRTAIDKATGEALGFAALNFAGEGTVGLDPMEFELGWWLDPAAWGHGLARETGAAIRDEAFTRLDAPSVIARIQPGNASSIAVAEAVGLTFDFSTNERTGEAVAVYRLTAAEYGSLGPLPR
jgi:RimJ/RimL family protein N-acetyltransferase